uniref:Exocyst complex component Sec3 C-terminal domain-containing protein n=1 Tax=Strigops habroptila TaxID=2489341 RepID=A0A672U2Q2_STRHB
MRIAEGNVSRGRHGACWAYPKCLTPVDWSFLIQHIVILQNLLAQDAVDANTMNNLDFDLHLDKVYKWTASSLEEKKTFIRCLRKLNHRFLAGSIAFVNVPSCAAEGNYFPCHRVWVFSIITIIALGTGEAESQEELHMYQEMSPKEAADVLKLMEEYEPLVNNSVAFAEQLSNDLHVLDEANLRAIISSEKQVTQLMSNIDEALAEVARVEETLQIYNELLGSVKQQMDHIHQENSLLHRIISNKTRLMDEILFLTTHLNLSREHCDALSRADLSSPSRVKACIAAAEALSACMNIQIHPGDRLYDREIKALFEQAKTFLVGRRKGSDSDLFASGESSPVAGVFPRFCAMNLSPPGTGSAGFLTCPMVSKQILEQVLRELQPLCTAEQQFIEKFFQLSHDAADLEVSARTELVEGYLILDHPGLLSEIFSCLEPELRGFLDICNKIHPFGCLQVLVTLNDSIFEMWDSSSALPASFLNTILGNMLLLTKNSFNKCIVSITRKIEETRMPSKLKGGILPSVSRFEEFVSFSEEVFRTAQRRRELDKAHLRLASSVFINSLSSANLKVNTDMVMMENFHHIHCFLCQKMIHCLEDKKIEAKQRYSEHMEKYIITYLGQPLEKLNQFFEGVKARVAQGVKEEEISFQLAYSKQELRKVIDKYPGKEVKRALETLYKKIHKDLSPEENLLPVVWHAMEQELIHQYQEFEDLIQRCYAGSGIAMDFTVEDLLSYFSSITVSNM